jgi:hypothetical protein
MLAAAYQAAAIAITIKVVLLLAVSSTNSVTTTSVVAKLPGVHAHVSSSMMWPRP